MIPWPQDRHGQLPWSVSRRHADRERSPPISAEAARPWGGRRSRRRHLQDWRPLRTHSWDGQIPIASGPDEAGRGSRDQGSRTRDTEEVGTEPLPAIPPSLSGFGPSSGRRGMKPENDRASPHGVLARQGPRNREDRIGLTATARRGPATPIARPITPRSEAMTGSRSRRRPSARPGRPPDLQARGRSSAGIVRFRPGSPSGKRRQPAASGRHAARIRRDDNDGSPQASDVMAAS